MGAPKSCPHSPTMKFKRTVTSSRRKNRRNHFQAPSNKRRKIMSAPLHKDLRATYGVLSMPIRKEDEVEIVRGSLKGRDGKVTDVYRRKYVVHIEKITRDKANGQTVKIGVHPSNLVIKKLKLDKDRKAALARRRAGANTDDKLDEKFTETEVSAMSMVN